MKARKVPVEITLDQRLAAFTARLTPEMVDVHWAADLARRLLAYDPLAETYEAIRFFPAAGSSSTTGRPAARAS